GSRPGAPSVESARAHRLNLPKQTNGGIPMKSTIRNTALASCVLLASTLAYAGDDKDKDKHDQDEMSVSVETETHDTDRSVGDRVDDAALTATVKGRLMWSRDAEALNTDVDTENGVVT